MPEIASFAASPEGFDLRVDLKLDQAGTVGCHWLDPASGRFLRESPWQEAAPATTLVLSVPAAPGLYRFCVTTREGSGWAYSNGQPFLAIDVEVTDSGITIQRQHVTTLARLRRETIPATLRDILLGPWLAISDNRHLIASMVRRDIVARYRGSFADAFWALLNPLLLMLTYYFVFGVFLRTRFPGDPSQSGYVLFFLSGMLPWLAMNESIARSPNSTLEHRNLITKVIFPVEVLPLNLTLSGLVTGLTATAIFFVFLLVSRHAVPPTALWLPVLWVPQFLLTAGICYLLAATGVYIRDLVYVMGLLLTMWFFMTPICYPESNLPPAMQPVLTLNPLYVLVRAYRAIFIENAAPDWRSLSMLGVASLAIFYTGFAVFRRARRGFADVL